PDGLVVAVVDADGAQVDGLRVGGGIDEVGAVLRHFTLQDEVPGHARRVRVVIVRHAAAAIVVKAVRAPERSLRRRRVARRKPAVAGGQAMRAARRSSESAARRKQRGDRDCRDCKLFHSEWFLGYWIWFRLLRKAGEAQ